MTTRAPLGPTVARTAKVLVADDHVPTRVEVVALLERAGYHVCASVGNAAAAVTAAVRERPDACVVDVRMPGGGIRAATEIAARLPGVTLVMLTVCVGELELFAALAGGARGYVLKDEGLVRLPQRVADALAGEAVLSAPFAARVLEEFRDRGPRRRRLVGAREHAFTSREWEILELLALDLSTASIARRLCVAPATVRSHIRSILAKVGATDRRAALGLLGFH